MSRNVNTPPKGVKSERDTGASKRMQPFVGHPALFLFPHHSVTAQSHAAAMHRTTKRTGAREVAERTASWLGITASLAKPLVAYPKPLACWKARAHACCHTSKHALVVTGATRPPALQAVQPNEVSRRVRSLFSINCSPERCSNKQATTRRDHPSHDLVPPRALLVRLQASDANGCRKTPRF